MLKYNTFLKIVVMTYLETQGLYLAEENHSCQKENLRVYCD